MRWLYLDIYLMCGLYIYKKTRGKYGDTFISKYIDYASISSNKVFTAPEIMYQIHYYLRLHEIMRWHYMPSSYWIQAVYTTTSSSSTTTTTTTPPPPPTTTTATTTTTTTTTTTATTTTTISPGFLALRHIKRHVKLITNLKFVKMQLCH